jgi:hypothetical protein
LSPEAAWRGTGGGVGLGRPYKGSRAAARRVAEEPAGELGSARAVPLRPHREALCRAPCAPAAQRQIVASRMGAVNIVAGRGAGAEVRHTGALVVALLRCCCCCGGGGGGGSVAASRFKFNRHRGSDAAAGSKKRRMKQRNETGFGIFFNYIVFMLSTFLFAITMQLVGGRRFVLASGLIC